MESTKCIHSAKHEAAGIDISYEGFMCFTTYHSQSAEHVRLCTWIHNEESRTHIFYKDFTKSRSPHCFITLDNCFSHTETLATLPSTHIARVKSLFHLTSNSREINSYTFLFPCSCRLSPHCTMDSPMLLPFATLQFAVVLTSSQIMQD